ncbi:MAG: hypothetical protein Ct9H300mP13_6830 [Gammaproteobacteria bacterium]|nr:MAG: hypothetical protein Ct9H300mP13_6830 [Gammaproteobacteria bacterium]
MILRRPATSLLSTLEIYSCVGPTIDGCLTPIESLIRKGGHRDEGRLSIAFFNQPNYDTLIECLPSLRPAKYLPVLSGEYRDLKYQKTGLTSATRPLLSE